MKSACIYIVQIQCDFSLFTLLPPRAKAPYNCQLSCTACAHATTTHAACGSTSRAEPAQGRQGCAAGVTEALPRLRLSLSAAMPDASRVHHALHRMSLCLKHLLGTTCKRAEGSVSVLPLCRRDRG